MASVHGSDGRCFLLACACAEGAIDEAMAEVLDEEFPGGVMNGAGGAFVV
jgi:hypothetical protein